MSKRRKPTIKAIPKPPFEFTPEPVKPLGAEDKPSESIMQDILKERVAMAEKFRQCVGKYIDLH
jgi:hypothetical protein